MVEAVLRKRLENCVSLVLRELNILLLFASLSMTSLGFIYLSLVLQWAVLYQRLLMNYYIRVLLIGRG